MNQLSSFQLSEGLQVHFHMIGFSKTMEAVSLECIKKMGLPEDFVNKVCITGQVGDLVMIQFKDNLIPSPDSPQEHFLDFQQLNQIRGWVFNIRTMTLIARSVCEDRVVFGPVERLQNFKTHGFSFFPFVEGTIVRFVYDGSKWISLTQRRIDASKTKIPETNIQILESMTEICPTFNTDLLDPSMVYVFMVVDPQNQIMNPNPVEESVIFLDNLRNGQSVELDQRIVALENMSRMQEIPNDQAYSIVQNQGWILLKRGNELFRYGLPQMANLLRVRYINGNPHFTPAYLYLCTHPEDRKYLPYAVPAVMRNYVTEEFMNRWCNEKALNLIEFLVMCKIAFSSDMTFKLNFELRKLCTGHYTPPYTGDRVVLNIFYSNMISQMLAENPLEFYKLCKSMDHFNANFHKTNLVKIQQVDGLIFMNKKTEFSLPIPDFSKEPTVQEAAKKNKKRTSTPQKPVENIKKQHRAAKKKPAQPRQQLNLADLLHEMNIN